MPLSVIAQAAAARQRRCDSALTQVGAEVLAVLGDVRAAGLRLALVSNASTGEVQAWPDSPLARDFDATLFSCKSGHRKPDARIYEQALAGLGVEAAQCAFVGDGGSDDLAGAARVGLWPVLSTQFIVRRPEAVLEWRRRTAAAEVAWLAMLPALFGLAGAPDPAAAPPGP